MHDSNDPLHELLMRTDRAPEPPPGLAAEVRRQIAANRDLPAVGWFARLEAVFSRPSFAAAFVAACVLLGLFLAEARLSRLHAARTTQVARSYVQLIDPLLAASEAPSTTTSQP
jgi:hypothetical protein